MKRFQYDVRRDADFLVNDYTQHYGSFAGKLEAKLNEMGAQGWELMPCSIEGHFVFKREKPSIPVDCDAL